ncbi:thiamine pyrophosphate-binding protein [Streptomyces sp. NPDC057798]|uniref:thiamine pyrophosphate-binding protein n=1 Tax=Streptomyces sp. NPDC057798 TaxID=3346252 RepID=UPI003674FA77
MPTADPTAHGTGAATVAPPYRVVDHIVEHLADEAGVRHLFGVHGANIEDVFDAVFRAGRIEAVLAKHEFSAAAMADGYHRAGNRLAVVAATSGGGALNLVPALGEAYASRVPVLALVGQPPTAAEGRGAFQDQSGLGGSVDARAVFSGVAKFCARVESAEAAEKLLPLAVQAALSEPRGPAVLLLPKDVQQAVMAARPARSPVAGPQVTTGATAAGETADGAGPADCGAAGETARGPEPADCAGPAADALEQARRDGAPVLVVAGPEVVRSDARQELARFVAALGAWVSVEPDAKDAFDNHDPRFVGVAGVIGHPSVRHCLERAAVCVLVGTRFPQTAAAGLEDALPGRTLICLNREPAYPPSALELPLGGGLRQGLRAVTTRLEASPPRPGPPFPPHPGLEYLPHERSDGEQIALREIVETVARALPEDANVVSDAGNTGCGVMHFLPAPRHGRYLLALGMGGMGFSFGAGIGAALANGRRTVVLAGDGSFFMHGMEVHTAVEHQLPITFVLFNNNAHAACLSREEFLYSGGRPYNVFRPSDLGQGVAAMFPGLRAATVRRLDELRDFLAATARSAGPAVVSIEVRTDEVPPYLPFVPFFTTRSDQPTEGVTPR